jgi:hypothetical protein
LDENLSEHRRERSERRSPLRAERGAAFFDADFLAEWFPQALAFGERRGNPRRKKVR